MSQLNTIAPDDWKRAIKTARATPNSISDQIKQKTTMYNQQNTSIGCIKASTPEPTKRESQIHNCFATLEANIEWLDKVVTEFVAAVSAVSHPESPEVATDKSPEEPSSVPMASGIYRNASKVARIARGVEAARSRLAL